MGAENWAAASMGTSAAGSYMAFQSNRAAAKRIERIGDYNYQVGQQTAEATRKAYDFAQRRAVKEGRRIKGTMTAKAGASGAMLDVGAPIRAEADLANELNIDQLLIAYEGEQAAQRAQGEAAIAREQGKIQARQYKAAATASAVKGASTLLQGFSTYSRDFG